MFPYYHFTISYVSWKPMKIISKNFQRLSSILLSNNNSFVLKYGIFSQSWPIITFGNVDYSTGFVCAFLRCAPFWQKPMKSAYLLVQLMEYFQWLIYCRCSVYLNTQRYYTSSPFTVSFMPKTSARAHISHYILSLLQWIKFYPSLQLLAIVQDQCWEWWHAASNWCLLAVKRQLCDSLLSVK